VWKAIAVGSILVELGGFARLARELIRTNRDILIFTKSISGEIATFSSITISDGPGGRGEIEGGTIGFLSPQAEVLRRAVESGKVWTYIGLGITFLGVVGQMIGTYFS
jgi:hypothetical protein